MSDLEVLRDLATQIQPPVYNDLVAVARRRSRRSTIGVGLAAVAVVLGVGVAGAAWSGAPDASPPARTATPTPSTGAWPPERIRAEGRVTNMPEFRNGPSVSGLDAQLYCVAQSCSFLDSEKSRRWALELTQARRSALFDVEGIPWGKDFDADSILVQDGADDAVRFRLLHADGTAVPLRMLGESVAAAPGPHVMLIESLGVYRRGYLTPSESAQPYLVDDRAGTIRPLDVPQEVDWWGPNVDEFLWGANGCRVFWQRPDGSFAHHQLDCQVDEGALTDPTWLGGEPFADWLTPDRMALVERNDDGTPLAIHASLDRGATWKRVDVEDRNWNGTAEQTADALSDTLQHLG